MRKTILGILLIGICTSSFAQTYGVKAGLSLATVNQDEVELTPGIVLGPTVDYNFNKNYSFQTALLLSSRGFKIGSDLIGNSDVKASISLMYLEIPLLLKRTFDVNEKMKAFGTFGPYVGYALSGKAKASVGSQSASQDLEFGNGNMKRMDVGLSIGTGVEINALQFGVAYELGLANIGGDMKNRVFNFTVGYKF